MKFTTQYKTIKDLRRKTLRSVARKVALDGLSMTTKLASSKHFFEKPRVHFLYFHHIFEDEAQPFDELLRRLSKTHTFVSHSEAIALLRSGKVDKPYLSLSSDDGFKNNLKAAEILNKYDAKCCFFVNPNSIGLTDQEKVKAFCAKRLHFPPTEFMTWNDLEDLLKQGHEIGNHTMDHIKISETPMEQVEEDMHQTFEIFQSKIGGVKHFAYPYGRYFHFNAQAHDLVFKAGYESCSSAERGCHITDRPIGQQELFIRREHMVLDWNLDHIMYFILNSSKKADQAGNYLPANY